MAVIRAALVGRHYLGAAGRAAKLLCSSLCNNTPQTSGAAVTSRFNSLYNVDVQDFDILFRPLLVGPGILDLVYHIQSLNSSTENSVLVVKPWLFTLSAKCKPLRRAPWGKLLTVFSVVIKNWLAFVFGPALAMLTV